MRDQNAAEMVRVFKMGPLVRMLIACTVAAFLSIASAQSSNAQVSEDACLHDYGFDSLNDCSANDVRIATLTVESITNSCTQAPVGQATMRFRLNVETGPDRYDIAVWISTNGYDPRNVNAECHHAILSPNATSGATPRDSSGAGPFWELEGGNADSCGDVQDESPDPPAVDAIFLTEYITVDCTDVDGDGMLDVIPATSWDNNANGICNNVTDAVPSTSSKCLVSSSVNTDLALPAAIDVTKTTLSNTFVSQAGSLYTYDVVFEVVVKNDGVQDLDDLDVFDDLTTAFAGADSFAVTNVQLTSSDFTNGGSVAVNSGFTGIAPNHNLVNTAATRRLNYDDIAPAGVDGDSVTFQFTVRYVTECSAAYTNSVTAIGSPMTGSNVSDTDSAGAGCTPTALSIEAFDAKSNRPQDLALMFLAGIVGLALVVSVRQQ